METSRDFETRAAALEIGEAVSSLKSEIRKKTLSARELSRELGVILDRAEFIEGAFSERA
jgi:hypothetical protein